MKMKIGATAFVLLTILTGLNAASAHAECGAIPASRQDILGTYHYYIDEMVDWHKRAIDAYRVKDMTRYRDYDAKSNAAGERALAAISDPDELARFYTAFQLRTFQEEARRRKNGRTIVGDNVYNTFEKAEGLAYRAYSARKEIEDRCRDEDTGSGTGWPGTGSGNGSGSGSGSSSGARYTCRLQLAFEVYEGWGNSFDEALEEAIVQCGQINWESACRGFGRPTCRVVQ